MSQYTKTTNFASKDNLSPGNPLKIVKGTEIDTEFNNIATAVATKTDNASAAITGGSITGITDLAVADGGTGASTAAGALNNLLPSQTSAANKYLQSDGTNASWDAVSLSTADITGTLPVANGGTGVTTSTGTGAVVLSNSPTLVTPALGTPTSGTATNLTGLPISTGVSGLGTGVATFLGTPSSANLASAVTDETGSGALVFANSPTLVTPALGIPSSGTLTNATGLPISTGVSGLGTNVATFLATPSSANLISAVTDETGTGSLVFATSPTLVTPALGTPSALVGTNITGTASGLTAGNVTTNANLTGAVTSVGNATSLGSFSSSNLAGALTDETGSGSAVFATSPTLVTPILGTPTSATLTNATGLPISTGVSGLGTGVATALAVNVGSSGAPLVNGGVLGTPSSGTATNLTGLPLSTGVTGTLPVANGGTGTATPSIVAGTNVTVTGTWPNQTIAASGGGGSPGGSTTQVQYNNAGAFGGITGATSNGTALTLVAPVLGTPASATLTNATGLPISTGVSGLGTGIATALAVNTGSAGAPVINGGALGTPTSGTVTNLTGTASININGTVGATTASTGAFTTLTSTGTINLLTVSRGGGSVATNTAVGTSALAATATGANNTGFGNSALAAVLGGSENTGVGQNAGKSITTGTQNTAVGAAALRDLVSGSANTSVGYASLLVSTAASNNVAIGTFSQAATSSGASNTSVGTESLRFNTTASGNTAVGYQAGYTNTTGAYNTAMGYQALYSGTTALYSNSAVGYQALYSCTGEQNTALGYQALKAHTSNSNSTAVGWAALTASTGTGNTSLGAYSGQGITTGTHNVCIGTQAGQAGTALTTGSEAVYIGYQAAASGAGVSSETVLGGGGITGKGANTAFIGGSSGSYQGNNAATWSVTSDQRLKKNIADNNVGLDAINSIRVRNFEYRVEEEITELPTHTVIKKNGVQLGVIAQELQTVLPECVKTESTGVMSVDSDNLTWYMINAIKELKAEFDAYKASHP